MAGGRPAPEGRVLRLRPSRPPGYGSAVLQPAASRWEPNLGEYVLDWDDVEVSDDPHGTALAFVRSAVRHSCAACDWDPALAASVDGSPPPVTGGIDR